MGLLLDSSFVQDSYCEAFCMKLASSFDTDFVGMVHTVRMLGVVFFAIDIKISKDVVPFSSVGRACVPCAEAL